MAQLQMEKETDHQMQHAKTPATARRMNTVMAAKSIGAMKRPGAAFTTQMGSYQTQCAAHVVVEARLQMDLLVEMALARAALMEVPMMEKSTGTKYASRNANAIWMTRIAGTNAVHAGTTRWQRSDS